MAARGIDNAHIMQYNIIIEFEFRAEVIIIATTNISVRMDEELKRQAEELFSDLGLNMTTALTAFVKQAVREQRIPFIISRDVPNEETKQAIEEIQQIKKDPYKKKYPSFSDLLEEVKHEV